MLELNDTRRVDSIVRALSTASRSLRLYPSSSPIPLQSMGAFKTALDEYFTAGETVLALSVAREGFRWRDVDVAQGVTGTAELVSELRDLGVAEVDILPGSTTEEILAFLDVAGRDVATVREGGGLAVMLVSAGVETIRVTDVHLTVVDHIGLATPDQDVDEFLRDLVKDPGRVSAWFGAASAGDPHAFEEGLMELVRVSGPSGFEGLLQSLAGAFTEQSPDGKDALLGLSMDTGPVRDLAAGVFRFLGPEDIAGSVLEGTFGKNMLSLSTALTHLPLDQVTARVRSEIQAMLPGAGRTTKEARFLDHMIEVRERKEPEVSLVDRDATYRTVLEASALPHDTVDRARQAVSASGKALSAASVRTMAVLLDQQQDFELFCQGATSLAAMVPRLIEQGDLTLASSVLADLSGRASMPTGPWPELSERLREALAEAVNPAAMAALLRQTMGDPGVVNTARQILRYGGSPAATALVSEGLRLKAEGLEVAEELVGRRIIDILHELAPHARWVELRVVVGRLARETDPRSAATIQALLRRDDEQSRREVIAGLADAGSPQALKLLTRGLEDPSTEVVIVAARSIARCGQPGAAEALCERLRVIDIDSSDFAAGREIIYALATMPDGVADETLKRLASRKALIKRGHFVEVQQIAAHALSGRSNGGARH